MNKQQQSQLISLHNNLFNQTVDWLQATPKNAFWGTHQALVRAFRKSAMVLSVEEINIESMLAISKPGPIWPDKFSAAIMSFQGSATVKTGFLSVEDTINLYTLTLLLKTHREITTEKGKRDRNFNNKKRLEDERVEYEYFMSLWDTERVLPPIPQNEISANDVGLLHSVLMIYADIECNQRISGVAYDIYTWDIPGFKRGIRLSTTYKPVQSKRRTMGLPLDKPRNALFDYVVEAGYLATSAQNRRIGIAPK